MKELNESSRTRVRNKIFLDYVNIVGSAIHIAKKRTKFEPDDIESLVT